MGDRIIVTEEDSQPAKPAEVIVVTSPSVAKPEEAEEEIVVEKTTITKTKAG
jgi:hypothetical protein